MSTYGDKINSLPNPEELKERVKKLVSLEDLREPASEHSSRGNIENRLANFEANWEEGVDYAFTDDGGGNVSGIIFKDGGAFAFGFDHESDYNAYAENIAPEDQPALQGVPKEYEEYLTSPELAIDVDDPQLYATVAFWWDKQNERWSYNEEFVDNLDDFDSNGFDYFFEIYCKFTPEEYERSVVEWDQTSPTPEKVKEVLGS
jgi:hypothetical protein